MKKTYKRTITIKHSHYSKASLNRWMLSCILKVSTDSTDLKFSRREFQSLGATASKAKSFLVLIWERGTTNEP